MNPDSINALTGTHQWTFQESFYSNGPQGKKLWKDFKRPVLKNVGCHSLSCLEVAKICLLRLVPSLRVFVISGIAQDFLARLKGLHRVLGLELRLIKKNVLCIL